MRKILFALLLLAFAVPATAQQQYGRLEGAARDAQGLALPGVSVSLTGEAIIGGRNATTDIDGSYRFQALPPGDYNIQFELSGFQTVVFEAVRVVTGATFTVDANMQIATVAETVTVTGESPVVDVKSTGVAATFDKTQLDEVPTATDMWAVLQQSPGVRVQGFDVGGSHKSQQSMYETLRGAEPEPGPLRGREHYRGFRQRGRLLRLLRDGGDAGLGAGLGRGDVHPGRADPDDRQERR